MGCQTDRRGIAAWPGIPPGQPGWLRYNRDRQGGLYAPGAVTSFLSSSLPALAWVAPNHASSRRKFGAQGSLQFLPEIAHILFSGTQVADGDTNGIFAAQFRMGKEEMTGRVDAIHDALVQAFQRGLVIHPIWMSAETDGAERRGSHALEVRRFVHPLRDKLAQANVFANAGGQALLAKVAHHHPELERAETAAQRGAIIHQVGNFIAHTLGVAQVFRYQTEGGFDHIGLACVEDATIDGGKEPFVRVDDQAIGTLAACQHRTHLWRNSGRTAIGPINVQPEAIAFADIGELRHRVYAGSGSGANGGHDGERAVALGDILLNGALKLSHIHAELAIDANLAQPRLPDAQHDARLFNRRVRLLRSVVAQARHLGPARHALLANVQVRNSLTRRRQGVEDAGGCGVVDDAKERARQTEHLAQPVQRHLLQFRRRRRGAPEHGIDVQRAGKHLAEDAGARTGNAKIGHETRRVPVRNAGHQHAVNIGEDSLHCLRLLWRLRGQRVANVAGSDLCQHRVVADPG